MSGTIKDNREQKFNRKNSSPKKPKMQPYSKTARKRMTEDS